MSANKAELLFAAHDPAAARLLAPVCRMARARDMAVDLLAAGPARAVWAEEELAYLREVKDIGEYSLLLTGTSFHASFDRDLWKMARAAGIPSLAGLDAWINLKRRFLDPDNGETAFPDIVIAIDEDNRRALLAEGVTARIEIGGQPHLEALTGELRRRRKSVSRPPLVAFFSEPIDTDFPDGSRGFDQYMAAAMLLEGLAAHAPVRLTVQPHPRENPQTWEKRLVPPPGVELSIGGRRTDELLAEAALVAGMTSMVLIEAALAGIPVLSLQPERKFAANPVVDRLGSPVTRPDELAEALLRVLSGTAAPPPPELLAAFDKAGERYLELIRRAAGLR